MTSGAMPVYTNRATPFTPLVVGVVQNQVGAGQKRWLLFIKYRTAISGTVKLKLPIGEVITAQISTVNWHPTL